MFDVTVYQPGWRLGGKLASGRNPAAHMRNEEHGLHVWFGFYDNAFRLAREVYDAWTPPRGCPVDSVDKALVPQVYTPVGQQHGDAYASWDVRFGQNPAVPGTPPSEDSGAIALGRIVMGIRTALANFTPAFGDVPNSKDIQGRHWWRRLSPLSRLGRTLDRLYEVLPSIESVRGRVRHPSVMRARKRVAAVLRWLPAVDAATSMTPAEHLPRQALEFFAALFMGLTDPRYRILADFDLDRIDHLDFREWLRRAGASEALLATSALVRVPYDATFQYEQGDHSRPSFAAGVAARFVVRSFFGYRGAAAYLVEGGMGEVFIAPLYEVLKQRGVKFEFFHRLSSAEVDPEASRIETLWFRQQAQPRADYEPLTTYGGLRCWSTQPDWLQLRDGEALRREAADFENDPDLGSLKALRDGVDFDEVVLALPAGALKSSGGRPSCVAAVLEHSPALGAMVDAMNLVPSFAAQLWCTPTLPDLGWTKPRPAMVGWAHPYCVWADMSPVVAMEGWAPGATPGSTHYLCGAAPSAHLGSTYSRQTLREIHEEARVALEAQLQAHGPALWPNAQTTQGSFDWNVLHDPEGRAGPERLRAQYVRGNVLPSDLCDGAAPGTSILRPEAHESGLGNAVLAGTWTRTSVNSTCVEAATMSGLSAARVLTGPQRQILGEFFMQRPRRPVWREPAPASAPSQWRVG